jgi:ribosomal protein S1
LTTLTTETDYSQFAKLLEEYDANLPSRGEYVRGEVLEIEDNYAIIDIGGKRDAIIPIRELNRVDDDVLRELAIGDFIPVRVLGLENQENELTASLEQGLELRDWERAEQFQQTRRNCL